MSKEVSERIDALRYILILFVVLAHASQYQYLVFDGMTNTTGYDSASSLVLWFTGIFTTALSEGVVPVFFCFSGFLFFLKKYTYKTMIVKKVKRLLIPLILLIALNLVLFILAKPLWAPYDPALFTASSDVYSWVQGLIFNWTSSRYFGGLIVFQLWYVRDLFIMCLLSPLIYFFVKKFSLLYILVVGVLLLANQPTIVNPDSLFFFSFGAFLGIYRVHIVELIDKVPRFIIPTILLVLYTVWFVFDGVLYSCLFWIMCIVSAALWLEFSRYLVAEEKRKARCLRLSEYTYFVHLFHAGFTIDIFRWLWVAHVGIANDVTYVLGIVVICLGTALVCTAIGIFLRNYCNPLYRLLTGSKAKSLRN